MKGLSLTQPWATLVAIKAKRIETRSWSTNYRGVVAIHAAKAMPTHALDFCYSDPARTCLRDALGPKIWRRELPLGAIIAVARLTDCRRIHEGQVSDAWKLGDTVFLPTDERELAFGDYTAGRWMWFLCKIRQLSTPIPCRGALGLWELTPEVILQINAQLGIDAEVAFDEQVGCH